MTTTRGLSSCLVLPSYQPGRSRLRAAAYQGCDMTRYIRQGSGMVSYGRRHGRGAPMGVNWVVFIDARVRPFRMMPCVGLVTSSTRLDSDGASGGGARGMHSGVAGRIGSE